MIDREAEMVQHRDRIVARNLRFRRWHAARFGAPQCRWYRDQPA